MAMQIHSKRNRERSPARKKASKVGEEHLNELGSMGKNLDSTRNMPPQFLLVRYDR
jgi:hypothetical protein